MLASTMIKNAFIKIGKGAGQQSVGGADSEAAISLLNNLMYSVDYLGLGYTEVTAGSSEITTPAYTWKWMEAQLALELAPEFGQLESYIAIDQRVDEGWSAVLIGKSRIGPPQLHGNLPIGSGNRCPGDEHYYSETDSGILTETNQEVIVEDGTT